jgi:uncharacterized protein YkwD
MLNRCVLLLSCALLVACGEREQGTVREPGPLGRAPAAAPEAPDTRTMGAGAFGAQCTSRALSEEILQRVNAARAAGRRCGSRAMGPASALKWDTALHSAASGHSLDMAKRKFFDHRSPEGRSVSERVSASNYPWKSVGENIAGGDRSVAGVVESWLQSPEHCENLMDPNFNDVAVACVEQPGTQWGTYWTMVLGRKR